LQQQYEDRCKELSTLLAESERAARQHRVELKALQDKFCALEECQQQTSQQYEMEVWLHRKVKCYCYSGGCNMSSLWIFFWR
jgi:uncharacterized coiled-coil protein SlyX